MTRYIVPLIIAGVFTGIAQLVNKHLSGKKFRSTTYTVATQLVGAIFALPLLFVNFYVTQSTIYWFIILLSAIFYAFCVYFLFKAYKTIDVSLVSIVKRLNILFTALFGIIFLNEYYSFKSYIGLLCIFFGSLIVLIEKKKCIVTAGIIFAVLSALFGSGATLLDKIILKDFSPFTYVFINNLLVGLVFVPRKGLTKELHAIMKTHSIYIGATSLLTTFSFVLVLIVMKQTNISIAIPIYQSVSFITPVVLGVTLFKELHKLPQKIIGTLCGIAGILFLSL